MRIPSGSTDRYIYFVAVDATDLKTRETGLSSFTVYRSRNGAAAAAMTTPTINEVDATNMPGVYELLADEDTTLAAGNDAEELCLHITHASMAPVTRVVEIYRPETTEGNTLGVESDGHAHADLKEWLGNAPAALADTDKVQVSLQHGAANVITASLFAADAITDAKVAADVTIASVTGSVASVTGNVGGNVVGNIGGVGTGAITAASFNSGAIDASAIASNAITAAKLAPDSIGASELAADAVSEIQNGLATSANQTTILNRLGAWTGSARNTILGAFQALFRKDADATVPSDVNADLGSGVGTADNADDSVQAIRDRGDAEWITATGFSTHTAAQVRSEMDSNSTQLAAIVADTNELQGDWADGGRLDLILDARASQASVDTIDGNVDSILVDTGTTIPNQISGLNDPTASAIASAVLAAGDVDGYSLEETLKLCLAALAAKLSGAATSTITIRAADDSKDRITATVDADGNRSAVTLDGAG